MRRSTLAAACVSVAMMAPASALAQFTYQSRNGSPRPSNNATSPIGLQDCETETWTLAIAHTFPSTPTGIEYWVSTSMTGCSTLATRNGIGTQSPTCWRVESLGNRGYANPWRESIAVRSGALVSPLNGNCRDRPAQIADTGEVFLNLLALPHADSSVAGSYRISYDLRPPESPMSATAVGGEGQAVVRWSYASTTTTTDAGTTTTDDAGTTTTSVPQDIVGFVVLCDPPVSAAADAGTLDGGTDGGAAGTCGTGAFERLDPNDDTALARYRCSGARPISAAATETVVSGLQNGVAYRFAVVAEDLAGNRSALSPSSITQSCVTPQPVTDFWEYYRLTGGEVRPGYCAARPGGASRGGAGAALVLGAALAALVARRRRSR